MKMANIPKIIGIIFLLLVFPLLKRFIFSDVLLFSSTEELLSRIGNDDIPLTIDNDLLLLLILGKMDGTLLGDVDILGLTNTGLVELLLVLFASSNDVGEMDACMISLVIVYEDGKFDGWFVVVVAINVGWFEGL